MSQYVKKQVRPSSVSYSGPLSEGVVTLPKSTRASLHVLPLIYESNPASLLFLDVGRSLPHLLFP